MNNKKLYMKFTCIQKDIENTLSIVGGIIPSHHALPILQCFLLELKKGILTVSGTNIEIGIKKSISIESGVDGIIAVPARVLMQTIHTINATKKISFYIEENTFCVDAGNGVTRIHTISHTDFPSIPVVDTKHTTTISKEIIINGLKKVSFSASKSLVKPELSGVYVYIDDSELVFVASDSFRLAEKKTGVGHTVEFPEVIIPNDVVQRITPVLEAIQKTDIQWFFEEDQVMCAGDGIELTFRVIDGTFPDYKTIIPKQTQTTVRVLTEDIKKALKKAALFSDTFSQVGIHILPTKNTITLSARNNTVGESIDSYTADIIGDELEINFNHRYLSEGLNTIHSESTTLLFNGSGKPLVVHPTDDISFTYLVMPMNR